MGFFDGLTGAAGGALAGSSFGPAGTVAGGLAGAVGGLFGGNRVQGQRPFNLPILKPGPAVKGTMINTLFGPQNINPNALLGGSNAASAYQNLSSRPTNPNPASLPQGSTTNTLSANPVPNVPSVSSTGQTGSMIAPQSTLADAINSYQGSNGRGFANSYEASQGYSPQNIASDPRNKNRGVGQIYQDLENGGYEASKIQDALQAGGYAQLGNAFDGANAFGGNLANTVGQLNNFSTNAANMNQSNVDALRQAVNSGANNFNNYFNKNVADLSGFDQASKYLQGIDLSNINNQANTNVGLGRDISSNALNDKDYLRSLLSEDRTQRNDLINQSLGFNVSPDLTNLANDIYSQNVGLGQNDLYSGTTNEAFRRQMLDTQNALAERGLGTTSSAFSDAAGRAQQQRDVLNSQLIQSELAKRSQNILDETNLNKQLASSGAGLTNQSSTAFAGNLAPLLNAATGGLSASTDAVNTLNNAANTGINLAQGLTTNAIGRANAANQGASTLLQGNQLTQAGLKDVGDLSNAGNQLGLSGLNSAGNLSAEGINAMTNFGQLGLGTQGQGFDQQIAQLNAIMQMFNNRQKLAATQAAARAGAGLTL